MMHRETKQQPILTISILVSNHYDNVKRCLESVKPLLDSIPSELILTDTGVTPQLRSLLEQFTDHIIDFTWCKDFSAARNAGLREARGQWFLYIDDDEWFEDTTAISDFLQSEDATQYHVACYIQRNYLDAAGESYMDHVVDRILRIQPELHFEHRVHEAYTGISIGQKKMLPAVANHYGYVYANDEEKIAKYQRNRELLELECREHPQDMRMRYQMVINPYTLELWDESIRLALDAIQTESDSEYWDACHTSIMYCLEQKKDWHSMVRYGQEFLQKKLYPYERLGIMQSLIMALWNTNQLKELCDVAEQALDLYGQYKKAPQSFNKNQLMQTTFVEKDSIATMLIYAITAGLCIGREDLMASLSTGSAAEEVTEILNTAELVEWIEGNVAERGRQADQMLHRQEEPTHKTQRELLSFEPSFFEREERNGFVIEPMVKNAWAANLEVLHSIDRICKENDIAYFADWGTLLGAVRHQGYIPWDDDIDICMLRKDYLRFCEVIDQYQDEVALLNNYTADDWGEHADKVINIAAFTINRTEIKEYHGFPFTAGVDIFVIDYVPQDKKIEEEWLTALRMISLACHIRDEMKELPPDSQKYREMKQNEQDVLSKIKKITGVNFAQPNPTNQELLILKDEVSGLYGDEDAECMTQVACLGVGMDYYLPKSIYTSAVSMTFENTNIPVPVGYDLLLRKKYGDDYMTPMNKDAGHDYPFYNKAIKELALMKGQEEEEVRRLASKVGTEYYYNFIHKDTKPRIRYDASYFAAETMDGVAVSEDRKRIWAAQIEVYLEVKRLCDENDIKLFVIGDTLRGAVERGTYMPASEDFHVAVMRSEYMRLLSILQEELGPWFDYRNVYAYEEHTDMRCYVVTDGYCCDPDEYLERFHGCPHIVGVDIAAIDGISEDKSKEQLRQTLVENLLTTAANMPAQPPYSGEVLEVVNEWRNLAQVDIDTNNNLQREYVKAADSVAGSYRGECNLVRISAELQEGRTVCYNKAWFHDTIEMDFATTTVSVPVGYKELLEKE